MKIPQTDWWRDAVIYQVYPRSFADSDGDGNGDLRGVIEHLDHLSWLGIDAIWLSPFMTSPQRDGGYDVQNYRDVDPMYGSLADFDELVISAHGHGIRVIVDIVPNHSSDQHAWFKAALAAPRGSRERGRYIFRSGKGAAGSQPPNNWTSMFGGPAWTRVQEPDGTLGDWYLHLFDTSQPDFDWSNPEVRSEFEDILRFWLERGVDGFRVDVAHGLAKDPELPDFQPHQASETDRPDESGAPYWAQDEVHEIFRGWRRVVESYGDDRALCGEVWLPTLDEMALWVRPDEMHQTFNFIFLETQWNAPDLRDVIRESLRAFAHVGAPPTWVLSNHDVVRHASRFALTQPNPHGAGIGPASPGQPIPDLGLRRARAATALMLALPGSAYLYQGEELGLPEVVDIPDVARRDPNWFRSNGAKYGRDGCRVPLPWQADSLSYGFGPHSKSWLPQPPAWRELAWDSQAADQSSTLHLYRRLLQLRKHYSLGTAELVWQDLGETAVAFHVRDILIIANTGSAPVAIPTADWTTILETAPIIDGAVQPNSTVWLTLKPPRLDAIKTS